MATAERLYSERGLDGVSLSEIIRVAGQRNKSALHYHFGGRDGLLRALIDRHRLRVDGERMKLLAEYGSVADLTLHDAVSILVHPLAHQLSDDPEGSVHYIRIMAQLSATPTHPANNWLFEHPPPAFAMIAPLLYDSIPHAPSLLRARRAQLMNGTMFHALLLQTYPSPDALATPHESALQRGLYVNDLIDCLCGLLTAPVSPESAEAIAQYSDQSVDWMAADDAMSVFVKHEPMIVEND